MLYIVEFVASICGISMQQVYILINSLIVLAVVSQTKYIYFPASIDGEGTRFEEAYHLL